MKKKEYLKMMKVIKKEIPNTVKIKCRFRKSK